MNRRAVATLAALMMTAAAPLRAHHSLVTSFQIDRTETVEGDLVELRWQNPHSVVYVNARNATGELHRYVVEWEAALQLMRQGVDHDTLKPGDHVIITGNPSRSDGDHSLHLRTIFRPKDGWRWQRRVRIAFEFRQNRRRSPCVSASSRAFRAAPARPLCR